MTTIIERPFPLPPTQRELIHYASTGCGGSHRRGRKAQALRIMLTDDEWAVLQPICPSETRANAWSWREFLDVELWLRRPRSRLSALENANAHRCRKRRAAEQGHTDRMLQSMRGLNGLAPSRKGELIDILTKCAKHGRRIPPTSLDARSP